MSSQTKILTVAMNARLYINVRAATAKEAKEIAEAAAESMSGRYFELCDPPHGSKITSVEIGMADDLEPEVFND